MIAPHCKILLVATLCVESYLEGGGKQGESQMDIVCQSGAVKNPGERLALFCHSNVL